MCSPQDSLKGEACCWQQILSWGPEGSVLLVLSTARVREWSAETLVPKKAFGRLVQETATEVARKYCDGTTHKFSR